MEYHHDGKIGVVSCRADIIMIAEHNDTKVYRIMFLSEVHEEKVKIVAKNQCLAIRILKHSEN